MNDRDDVFLVFIANFPVMSPQQQQQQNPIMSLGRVGVDENNFGMVEK